MATKTYYMILGVPTNESQSGIRAAYRHLAKTLHPDVTGEQGTSAFQELADAYSVLSDPRRRHEYNDELRRSEERNVVVVGQGRPEPEPERFVHDPFLIFGNPESIHPSYEAMRERFLRNFTGLHIPKSERLESVNLQVLLTPEEAWHGGLLPIEVPIFRRCPSCDGSGYDWTFPCVACRQQGVIESEAVVRVRIPPRIPNDTVLEVPLAGLGIHNFYLRIHVVVEALR